MQPKYPQKESKYKRSLQTLLQPIEQFITNEASSGLLLLLCSAIALLWANSAGGETYLHVWETPVSIGLGNSILVKSLHHWINDGLMVIFFFVVGLEIKRELLVGELSSMKKAALPVIAALGGMIVPASVYALFNAGGRGATGWGIPMATDIAFALGVVALMGSRVPFVLKVFLTALAIADDLGAVLVIALFYTNSLNITMLGVAAALTVLAFLGNHFGIRSILFYLAVGILLWWCVMQSGIHATIAGAVLAMAVPAKERINAEEFVNEAEGLIREFAHETREKTRVLANQAAQSAVKQLEVICEEVQTPLSRFESNLHTSVAFVIMPLFALANAGVQMAGKGICEALFSSVSVGIALGLFLGKPLGIVLFAWLACKLNLASLPENVSWRELIAISCLGGIGFTMSLFVENLAFANNPTLETSAKLGIFCGSILSGLLGYLLFRIRSKTP
ncbi:MAG: Na+/H+ antiporter NhaA [Candidatus Kapaibacterium sp.]|nr:MAG: Na+/H+ antiporter NhaA [Candidatus Kapabacteria bacterium]